MQIGNNQIGIKVSDAIAPPPFYVNSYPAGRVSTRTTSNLGLTGCYNVCGVTHLFNKEKRQECRARCDQQFTAEQQQQEQQQELLEKMLTEDPGGLSTGTIIGIIGGIVVLTIAGVVVLRKMKKKTA